MFMCLYMYMCMCMAHQDEERVLAVHHLHGAAVRHALHRLVPVAVAALLHSTRVMAYPLHRTALLMGPSPGLRLNAWRLTLSWILLISGPTRCSTTVPVTSCPLSLHRASASSIVWYSGTSLVPRYTASHPITTLAPYRAQEVGDTWTSQLGRQEKGSALAIKGGYGVFEVLVRCRVYLRP